MDDQDKIAIVTALSAILLTEIESPPDDLKGISLGMNLLGSLIGSVLLVYTNPGASRIPVIMIAAVGGAYLTRHVISKHMRKRTTTTVLPKDPFQEEENFQFTRVG